MNIHYFLTLALFSVSLSLAADCPSSCAEIIQERAVTLNRLTRLENLKQSNQRYIASLGQNDFSQRVKVTSNLLILDKRIESARKDFEPWDEKFKDKHCDRCGGQ